MRSTPRGRGVLHQRTTPGTQKSTISHRGLHDTKNGGFSTIGRTLPHAILTTSNASPPSLPKRFSLFSSLTLPCCSWNGASKKRHENLFNLKNSLNKQQNTSNRAC